MADGEGDGRSVEDPAILRDWFDSEGVSDLGFTESSWVPLIYNCSYNVLHIEDASRRKEFRDLALHILERGRREGALSDYYFTEQMIYARMCYLRSSDEPPEWRRQEAATIMGYFLSWTPLKIGAVGEEITHWQHSSKQVILTMRRIKTLLKLMMPTAEYLTGRQREQLSAWIELIPKLP